MEITMAEAVILDHAHEPAGLHGHDHGIEAGPWWKSAKTQLAMACGLALMAAYVVGRLMPTLDRRGFLAAMLVGLVPLARRAWWRRATAPVLDRKLMTIAAVGAVLIGATEEAATVVFLFLLGELLEASPPARPAPPSRD